MGGNILFELLIVSNYRYNYQKKKKTIFLIKYSTISGKHFRIILSWHYYFN